MNIINYCKDSYDELMHKTSWPARKELMNSAVVVITASLCIALLVFVIDTVFDKGMSIIYNAL